MTPLDLLVRRCRIWASAPGVPATVRDVLREAADALTTEFRIPRGVVAVKAGEHLKAGQVVALRPSVAVVPDDVLRDLTDTVSVLQRQLVALQAERDEALRRLHALIDDDGEFDVRTRSGFLRLRLRDLLRRGLKKARRIQLQRTPVD